MFENVPDTSLSFAKESGASFSQKKSRSSHPEVFLGKGVLKICKKFTGEHPRRSLQATLLKTLFQNTFS